MRALNNFSKPIRNSRGFLTAEFLFSLILCAGLCMVLFALNFSLSMAEVAQYIAFSTARAHAAAQYDQATQTQKAKEKFAELINHPALKPLFNNANGNSWFKLSGLDIRGGGASGADFADEYSYIENRIPQVGVRINFTASVLNMKIPFLGSTSKDPNGEGFTAKVTGLLIREPTQEECMELQVKGRYSAILNLDPRYKVLGGKGERQYVPLEDNGC